MPTLPTTMIRILAPFAPLFSERVFEHVQVLMAGAILTPGKRTVSSALRAMGLDQQKSFHRYHRVLSRAKWSSMEASRTLLDSLVEAFVPEGDSLVVGVDETLERRQGKKIAAKGIYRDPVRSSHTHLVKTSALRWICVVLLAEVPWASRVWALPFLSALAGLADALAGKTLVPTTPDRGRRRRWICFLEAPGSLPASEEPHRLHHSPQARRRPLRAGPAPQAGTDGKTSPEGLSPSEPLEGGRRPKDGLAAHLGKRLVWRCTTHGGDRLEHGYLVLHGLACRACALGFDPRSRRTVQTPGPPLCTDLDADPERIISWFVRRWQMEATFQEARQRLGFETQRHWSKRAIQRTAPALLGLFSVLTLLAHRYMAKGEGRVRRAAWYDKTHPTFSDALALVGRKLWAQEATFCGSVWEDETVKVSLRFIERLTDTVCYAA
jgi:DDE superfamily endonuclease